MITLCKTCGTAYQTTDAPPAHCAICEDERQFVPPAGQAWITPEELHAHHANQWQLIRPGLIAIRTVPAFAIDQRALLLMTEEGNILWDCIPNLDEATRLLIHGLGGLKAIAISHPHYYSTMQDWAAEFDAPVYLHADDRRWIVRDSPHIKLWHGEALEIAGGINLLRLGGHFPGGCVLHQSAEQGILLTGDIIQVAPGADRVSFMWSYPNMLPLAAAAVADIARRLEPVQFDELYGAFAGKNIPHDAAAIVQRSARHYIQCLTPR